jgi:uncharacterized BrkB/YihY/UPF0761 family membrane protein
MSFDHVCLVVSIALAVFLLGAISILSFIKKKSRKNQETFDKVHRFAKKLDELMIPTLLLGASVGLFLIWLVFRVVYSYT